jgi:hypothetical protein
MDDSRIEKRPPVTPPVGHFLPQRGALALSALGGLALTAFCVYAVVAMPYENLLELVFVRGVFGGLALASGALTLGWIRRMRNARTALLVDEAGILDGTSLGSPLFIQWEDIADLTAGTNKTLEVELTSSSASYVSWPRRFLTRMLRRRRSTHLAIPLAGLSAPAFEIQSLAESWWEARQLSEVTQGNSLSSGEDGDGLARSQGPGTEAV